MGDLTIAKFHRIWYLPQKGWTTVKFDGADQGRPGKVGAEGVVKDNSDIMLNMHQVVRYRHQQSNISEGLMRLILCTSQGFKIVSFKEIQRLIEE